MKVFKKLFKLVAISVLTVLALVSFPLLWLFVGSMESLPEFETDFLVH